ncbi:MAG: immunoglobulin domain-containing protein, partial [Verrucomicrobia bacterium]|nr:immunoglobulin domain-containing protein [Verrucomicrobiota bacterium]
KLEVGTWTHLACTWTPGVGFDFYKNGKFVETVKTASYPKDYVDKVLFIGAANSGGYCLFDGKLDRIRLHKGILKAEDLDADASLPRDEMNGTVLAYNFNESVLPFASSGTVSVSLYNAAGEEIPTNNVVNWSTSTPARDALWAGSESDYSLYLNNNAGDSTKDRIVFDTKKLDFGDQSDPSFSIEAWIKGVQRSSNKQVFFQCFGSVDGKAPRIAFAVSQDLTVYLTTLSILDIDTGVPIPEDGEWHHIACAYSHSEGIIYVYVDGKLKKEYPYDGGVSFRANTGDVLGCIGSETTGWYCYSGYVDRIRLHKGVLLASELDYVDYSQKITAPEISIQPKDQSVNEGDPVTFDITVNGTEPFNYQWYKDGVAINGAVESTYSIRSAQLSDAGKYSVRVSNNAGSVTSESAELKVESIVETYRVIADDASRMYRTANPAFTYRILDSADNDVTASIDGKPKLSTTALLGSPAGTYPISVTKGSLPKEKTYEFVAGTLTVTKVVPVIVWNTPEPVVAGTALSEVQLNASANVDGSFVYDPAAGTVLAEGIQTLKTTFIPNDSRNYESVEKTVELEVTAPVITEPTLTFLWENGVLILNFTGVLYESEDLENWTIIPDAHEVYKVELTTGKRQKYYRSSSY